MQIMQIIIEFAIFVIKQFMQIIIEFAIKQIGQFMRMINEKYCINFDTNIIMNKHNNFKCLSVDNNIDILTKKIKMLTDFIRQKDSKILSVEKDNMILTEKIKIINQELIQANKKHENDLRTINKKLNNIVKLLP
jgi:hypothetical protein